MKKYYYLSLITGFNAFCVEKGFRDGFLNKCKKDNIPLWKMRPFGEKLCFFAPSVFGERLGENAAFSGCELSVTGSFGILPFLKKHSDRSALVAGSLLCIIFLSLMSGRVWNIKVSGNDKVFESEILEVCGELGLQNGVKKKNIDVTEFQKELLEKLGDRLLWVSLNIEGMCAEIEVREIKEPLDYLSGEPCNIIADFDGVIRMCRVYSGTREINRGDGVHKGDLLISGVTEYETGETSFCEARGKITAEHTVRIKGERKKKVTVRKYTSSDKYYSLSFFGFEINPFFRSGENCEVSKREKYLTINGVRLPFYVGEYTVSYFESVSETDEAFLSSLCLQNYLADVREAFASSLVMNLKEKKGAEIDGKFDVIDYIGQKSVILLENQ